MNVIDTGAELRSCMRLSSMEMRSRYAVIAVIGTLHIVGWSTLLTVAGSQQPNPGTAVIGVGTGVTAYILGIRHAFDADHIAAIDNTIRKLMQRGKRPWSVGFWFSMGHSAVVFVLTLVLAVGIHAGSGSLFQAESKLRDLGRPIGTVVSAVFLCLIAALNVPILIGSWKSLRRMRIKQGASLPGDLQIRSTGIAGRLLGRITASIVEPWHMWPVGVLFGLGFDTASEIALLVLTGSGAVSGLPWYDVLCLPVLFAGGMSLVGTLEGSFMFFAYNWAVASPIRRIRCNLTFTGLSVLVALLVGGFELLMWAGDRLPRHGPLWGMIRALDPSEAGIAIVAIFAAAWMIAAVTVARSSGGPRVQ